MIFNYKIFEGKKTLISVLAKFRPGPNRLIVLAFLGIILFGATLLSLPIASRSGEPTAFIDSLFTATSATCVTGLIVYDTYQHWSGFGQIVIISLIQIGGLGFMTMATLFSLALRRTITLRERITMVGLLGGDMLSGIVRLTKHILFGTLIFESAGAILLTVRFLGDFSLADSIKKGIFHSVSAFCNAGFDLMGQKTPFISLMDYKGDFIVNFVIMSLITIGGLGFFVWEDIYNNRGFKKLGLHTKIVLTVTVLLIVGGAVFFFAAEYGNPGTLGPLSFKDKILTSFFQSVTTRTAGYNTISQANLTGPSLAVTCLLMFIGASPGSTAGGIKTVTAAVILLAAVSAFRGRKTVSVFKRSINHDTILRAVSITTLALVISVMCAFIITAVDGVSLTESIYEALSAFGTVGLTMGITPTLETISKLVLIMLMFFGRVGILTIATSLQMKEGRKPKYKYPEGKVIV